jgi:hypothetical protein
MINTYEVNIVIRFCCFEHSALCFSRVLLIFLSIFTLHYYYCYFDRFCLPNNPPINKLT